MKKILLWPNKTKDKELKTTFKVAELLNKQKAEIFVFNEQYLPFLPAYVKLSAQDETAFSAIVTIGGDGTILNVSKYAAENNIPIIGINMGSLGFMAELEADELETIENLIKKDYELEKRMMLDVVIERQNEIIYKDIALNDAVISKGEITRLIPLKLYADNNFISTIYADGVILSTPTGSTAYSISAGGPILEPDIENITITPICAHGTSARAIIISKDRQANVEILELSDKSAYLCVDGREGVKLLSGDIIKVSVSKYKTKLIKLKKYNFYEILNKKLLQRGI